MANKIYTADELRAESAELVDMLGEHSTAASMLRYAADIKERGAEALTVLDNMQNTMGHLDIETAKDIVKHILFGA